MAFRFRSVFIWLPIINSAYIVDKRRAEFYFRDHIEINETISFELHTHMGRNHSNGFADYRISFLNPSPGLKS